MCREVFGGWRVYSVKDVLTCFVAVLYTVKSY